MEGVVAIVLLLVVSMVLPGVINRVRAWISGRKGVTIYQHINNVEVLLKKGAVYSPVTTLIAQIAPAVYLGAAFTSLLFVPVGGFEALLGFDGDVVMFAYLLALSRLSLILAAMDSGSSFQGMGASREALYSALVEPALFIVAGCLALISGQTSFSTIFMNIESVSPELAVVLLLLTYTLIKIISVEMGRIPVDDTHTHLELTMIHEVMILDYCGIDLAMINIGSWLKMGAIVVLAANAVAVTFMLNWIVVVVLSVGVAAVIGVIESLQARNRLSRNTTYILTIVALAFVLFMVAYILLQNIVI